LNGVTSQRQNSVSCVMFASQRIFSKNLPRFTQMMVYFEIRTSHEKHACEYATHSDINASFHCMVSVISPFFIFRNEIIISLLSFSMLGSNLDYYVRKLILICILRMFIAIKGSYYFKGYFYNRDFLIS